MKLSCRTMINQGGFCGSFMNNRRAHCGASRELVQTLRSAFSLVGIEAGRLDIVLAGERRGGSVMLTSAPDHSQACAAFIRYFKHILIPSPLAEVFLLDHGAYRCSR